MAAVTPCDRVLLKALYCLEYSTCCADTGSPASQDDVVDSRGATAELHTDVLHHRTLPGSLESPRHGTHSNPTTFRFATVASPASLRTPNPEPRSFKP